MNKSWSSIALPFLGIVLGYGALLLFVSFLEVEVLIRTIDPQEGTDLADWITAFRNVVLWWNVVPAVSLGIVWAIWTMLLSGMKTDLRGLYLTLWSLALTAAFLSAVLKKLPETASGQWGPALWLMLNGLLGFWLMTGPWTIATHKFAPPGSLWLRNKLRY